MDQFVHHERLVHSLKVAQVGRRIAGPLRSKVSPEVVYSAGLAHDLGHPPFGHAAEAELMGILDGRIGQDGEAIEATKAVPILTDSFEGNAQSFRIIANIAARKKGEETYGLNLSVRTLAAVQKYPWTRHRASEPWRDLSGRKWGAYDSEAEKLREALEGAEEAGVKGPVRSVEADIMDWADDVSYAVHDTEDFYRAGLIPLHVLRASRIEWENNFLPWVQGEIEEMKSRDWDFDLEEFSHEAAELYTLLPDLPYSGDAASRQNLHRFGSSSIEYLIKDLSISSSKELEVPSTKRVRVEILKKLTRYFVVDRSDMRLSQVGQRKVVRDLFFGLRKLVLEDPPDRGARTLPGRLIDYCVAAETEAAYASPMQYYSRAVVDFICSLTDRQASAMADQLAGRSTRTADGFSSL